MSINTLTLSPRHEAQRAYLLLEHGELAMARRTLDAILEENPDDPTLAALRGAMELAAGELDVALKLLRLATRRWPEHPAAFVYLAETHLLQRRVSQARRALNKARTLCHRLDTMDVWGEHIACLELFCTEISPSQIPEPLISLEE